MKKILFLLLITANSLSAQIQDTIINSVNVPGVYRSQAKFYDHGDTASYHYANTRFDYCAYTNSITGEKVCESFHMAFDPTGLLMGENIRDFKYWRVYIEDKPTAPDLIIKNGVYYFKDSLSEIIFYIDQYKAYKSKCDRLQEKNKYLVEIKEAMQNLIRYNTVQGTIPDEYKLKAIKAGKYLLKKYPNEFQISKSHYNK